MTIYPDLPGWDLPDSGSTVVLIDPNGKYVITIDAQLTQAEIASIQDRLSKWLEGSDTFCVFGNVRLTKVK